MSMRPDGVGALSAAKRALVEIRRLRSRVAELERRRAEPIAIVGIGCRYPGGVEDPDSFWRLLRNGADGITEVPPDRWDVASFYDPDVDAAGKISTRYGGFLDHLDRFDADFFGISPREAVSMDPQQRLVLEVAWEALEHAGIAPDALRGSRSGVYVGISTTDYARLAIASRALAELDVYFATGAVSHAVVSGRLAYVLGLEGPALSVDTACSTSLVTVHLACQALRLGECDLAIAGGVNTLLMPENTVSLSRGRMLAPDGHCKPFSAEADGFGRAEGCGLVVLKRLSDAREDGDSVLAVIRGSALNQDGRSNGLTAPRGPAQEAVIRAALASAAVGAGDVSYVETHGAGTILGDPIEIGALGAVFADARSPSDPLLVGSVKSNLGHTETAAGIAGLIKVVLAMQHGALPPSLRAREQNPNIAWGEVPVRVVQELTPWKPTGGRRIAGVSSFGLSGTNAHIVLEEAPAREGSEAAGAWPAQVLALSARTPEALHALAERYRPVLRGLEREALADVCYTTQVGRARFPHRLAVLGTSAREVEAGLEAYGRGELGSRVHAHEMPRGGATPRVAFLSTGQGAQHPDMGRELYESLPVFREVMDRCLGALEPGALDPPLVDVLYPRAGRKEWAEAYLTRAAYAQPAQFALGCALAAVWRHWGVEPSVVLGHSAGEYVAACLAGVFSLEDGMRLVAARGRLMEDTGAGTMTVVRAGEDEVAQLVSEAVAQGGRVGVAAVNGPENVVVSGEPAAVARVTDALAARGREVTPLAIPLAAHSPLMDSMLPAFAQVAGDVRYAPPRLEVVSNVTGREIGDELATPEYWVRHTREPVQFARGLARTVELGCDVYIELGARPVLLGMGQVNHPDSPASWLPSLRPDYGDWIQMLESLAACWARGAEVDWRALHRAHARRRVALPRYPFQRQRFWIAPDGFRPSADGRAVRALATPSAELFYRVEWTPRDSGTPGREDVEPHPAESGDPARPPEGARRHWLVLEDERGLGSAVAEEMQARGIGVTLARRDGRVRDAGGEHVADFSDRDVWDALIGRCAMIEERPPEGVIDLWSLDVPPADPASVEAVPSVARRESVRTLRLLQAVAHVDARPAPRIWTVTRGVQPAGGNETHDGLGCSPLWGLGLVAGLERPDVWGGLIDLDEVPSPADAASIVRAVLTPGSEDRVALRDGLSLVPRLVSYEFGAPMRELSIRPDAAYLVTGGLGGVGLSILRWLADRGARHLLVVSRTGLGEGVDAAVRVRRGHAVRALRERGVDVRIVEADVGDPRSVPEILQGLAADTPLAGVVHAAGTADLVAIDAMSEADLDRVYRAKVDGAWSLHRATLALDLDFFVLFSSATATWGSERLAHYAAANEFLNALARHRTASGLPALSVEWGRWGGEGMTDAERHAWLESVGMEAFSVSEGLAALEHLLATGACEATVARMAWDRFKPVYEARGPRPLLAHVGLHTGASSHDAESDPRTPRRSRVLEELSQADPDERSEIIIAYLEREVAAVIGLAPDSAIDTDQGFFDMGMDSLMSVQLKTRIEHALECELPSTLTFDHPNVAALAEFLTERAEPSVHLSE